jgi:AcrR family transcriptional regulator
VVDLALARLPKGRHSLTREQVQEVQRLRLAVAMAECMTESGYVGTPVAAVLKRAGVSRQTFYELYDDKLACFLDALDLVGAVLVAELTSALETQKGSPIERAEQAIDRYLDTITEHAAFARLFLVEVYAAGPEAMRRRAAVQAQVAAGLAGLLDARTDAQGFACRSFVAAVSSLVTLPVVSGDEAGVQALRRPLRTLLRTLVS